VEASFADQGGSFLRNISYRKGYNLQPSEVVTQSKANFINWQNSTEYLVGTLYVDILDLRKNEKGGEVKLKFNQ